MCGSESRTESRKVRQIGMCPSSEYCLLKPSGLCFTSIQLKRRFAVNVVSVTRPSPHFRYNGTDSRSKHNNQWPLLSPSLSLPAQFHVCLLT